MSGRRFEGKSLDEAIDTAAGTLGCEPFRIKYHIVLQKRGFLGGTKRVVIEAEVDSDRNDDAPAPQGEATSARQEATPAAGERDGRREPPREKRGRRRRSSRREGPELEQDHAPIPAQEEQSPEEQRAAEWCADVLRMVGLRAELRTERKNGEIWIRFFGSDAKRMTERSGEVLDSIQVLANKALVGRSMDERIELDAADFKQKRDEEIGRKARDLADVVRREGRERLLPAMSPVERRIVHLALQDDEDVATESRGDGFLKRVAIVPREESQSVSE